MSYNALWEDACSITVVKGGTSICLLIFSGLKKTDFFLCIPIYFCCSVFISDRNLSALENLNYFFMTCIMFTSEDAAFCLQALEHLGMLNAWFVPTVLQFIV